MIVKPKTRGFICTTAHPAGCEQNVLSAIQETGSINAQGPKSVLVLGSSTGYGLASRIVAAFGYNAATIGVGFEREASGNRTGTAGWYNTAAFDKQALAAGAKHISINGDAFSDQIKDEVIEQIKTNMPNGKVDMVVYSLAAPKRTDAENGRVWSSVIKPIGKAFESRTVDFHTGEVTDVSIEPATDEEIEGTVKVMGGEDWYMWIKLLHDAGVLATRAMTLAFSYIGPEVTHAVYKDGTIGNAKKDLEEKCRLINKDFADINTKAYVSVNKALVTQASAAIPVVPLYIALLYKIMKEKGLHEGCTAQIKRMFEKIYQAENIELDAEGRIRMDDWEMREDVQREVMSLWQRADSSNIQNISDLDGYREEFYSLFGFGLKGIDYDKDIQI